MANLINRNDITKTMVWQMFSMLDWCYHRGVEDAHRLDDPYVAIGYLGKDEDAADFAWLGQDYRVCWQEYLLTLISRAARTAWKGYMRRYFDSISRYGSSYLSCFVPLTLIWYKRGVADYINNPDTCDMGAFMSRTRVYWTAKGIRNVDCQNYVEEIQYHAFLLERRDREIWENNTEAVSHRKGAMKPTYYHTFRSVVKLAAMYKKRWF